MSGEPGQTKQNLNKQGVMRSRTTEEEEGPTVWRRPETRMSVNSKRKRKRRTNTTHCDSGREPVLIPSQMQFMEGGKVQS